ncbi:hypothetical protein [Candidatus Poriferisocius sp.]|uniref:hypothetical protein n=1 Tax=Candidatus Poriferisocius sp. TaxID=3101276 RepID=UPI003B5177CA
MKPHTPRPWVYVLEGAEDRGMVWSGVAPICTLEQWNDANGHLIAAAPDMLTALEELCGLWDDETWSKAKAAIAKAKGETE